MDGRRFIPDRVIEPAAEFDAVVAAGIAHDDTHVADLARERIEAAGGIFVGRGGLADLERAIFGRRKSDVGVAVEQGAVDVVADLAVALLQTWRRRNIETDLELVDEVKRKMGKLLEAAYTEIRGVGRDRREPPEISNRGRSAGQAKT